MSQFTPAIQQYIDTKKQHPDCILFFRIGDFYETFFEDAKTCSKVLDLLLTSKNKTAEHPIPMAGIPHHSVDKYIARLVHHGYKVALAEQMTDPTPGKIVEREVTQIITPGTYIQEHLGPVDKKDSSYLLSIYFGTSGDGNAYHIAWGDFTLGEYRTKSFSDPLVMQAFILTLKPVEIIINGDSPEKDLITRPLEEQISCIVSIDNVPVDPAKFVANMCNVQTIASFGKSLEDARLHAFGLLLNYIQNTQKIKHHGLPNIVHISLHSQDKLVLMDDITLRNLEIFSSSYEGNEKYSLIGILDSTQTAGGSRLLRKIIRHPINDLKDLERRLDHIQYYLQAGFTQALHAALHHVADIPKIVSSILYKKLLPSPFVRLRATMNIFFEKQEMLSELIRLGLSDQAAGEVQHLYNYLNQLIKNDDEYAEDINFIRDGYDSQVDALRQIAFHSDELLLNYQQELIQASGISNVKLKFVMHQGYFIEITNKDISDFESSTERFKKEIGSEEADKFTLVRRNTLKGGQRYTSPYLDTLQEKVLKAKEDLAGLEFVLLAKAKEKIGSSTAALYHFSDTIAWMDVFTSQALFAQVKGYVRPEISSDKSIDILGGRHPVIEEFLPKDQQFIPNDLKIDAEKNSADETGFLHIITGPNMGGKSTYLRQNALIVLMAHCGLFVPAKSCHIGLVDGIFARVGSGDIIAKNQSTFMTEMIEVANILNNATAKSFVIFDELGRGTSTYDGLSLTKAILEYITTRIRCKTLIATHYHELIQLEQSLSGVQNYSVSVYETEKEVVFMKKIVKGGASKSYGLDVAKIAGIPKAIIEKARENLDQYQGDIRSEPGVLSSASQSFAPLLATDTRKNTQHDEVQRQKIKSILESFDLNNITPLQALQLLSKIKDELN